MALDTASTVERQRYHLDLRAVGQLLHGVGVLRVVLQQDGHLERGCLGGPGREREERFTQWKSPPQQPKACETLFTQTQQTSRPTEKAPPRAATALLPASPGTSHDHLLDTTVTLTFLP